MRMGYRAVKERRNIKMFNSKENTYKKQNKKQKQKGEQKYKTNKYMDKRRLS